MPSPYLLDRRRDLLFVTASPAWIIPLLFGLSAIAGDRAINTTVIAVGAMGHHLPGMLRAYGDRALFRRFRIRLLVAPVLLLAAAVSSSLAGLQALTLLAFVWGVWHAFMQSYGFARIYAGREGPPDPLGAALDRALLATGFVAAVVLSPLRLHGILDLLATCGVPPPDAALLRGLRATVLAAAGISALLWLGHAARRRPGARRALLIFSSLAFWWFANVRVHHLLLAMPLFELFHDAQYLSIVWLLGRRRASAAPQELAPALRALLGSWPLYLGAVALYGGAALLPLPGSAVLWLNGLFAASQLFHFYLDGFIWKVREPELARPLELSGGADRKAVPGLLHAGRWALLAAPALALVFGQVTASIPLRERVPALAALVPDNPFVRFQDAELHWERGEVEAALDGYRQTLRLEPDSRDARRNLALSLGQLADDAARRGQGAELSRDIAELAALRPTLEDDVAAFADQRLTRYSPPIAPRPSDAEATGAGRPTAASTR